MFDVDVQQPSSPPVVPMTRREKLERFRKDLRELEGDELREPCAELFADGFDVRDLAREILGRVSDYSVATGTWLPAASVINLSDCLIHVPLQLVENRHTMMAFGERKPPFARIESPPPIEGTIDDLRARFEHAAVGGDWQLGERCLLGIRDVGAVFEIVLECLLQPRYLGSTSGPWWSNPRHVSVTSMVHLWGEFGDDAIRAVLCNLGARECAKSTEHADETANAATLLADACDKLAENSGDGGGFKEGSFRTALGSGDLAQAFAAITTAWESTASAEQIQLAITMVCIERVLRGGLGDAANWDHLKRELQAASAVGRAGEFNRRLGFKAALHAAWHIVDHGDEGLADAVQEFSPHPIPSEDEQMQYVINGIASTDAEEAMHQTVNYLAGDHDPERLLREAILWTNEKCFGGSYYAGQRLMIDAWRAAEGHHERDRVLVGLVGWMTDYRNQHFNHRSKYGLVWGANVSDDGALVAIRSGGTRVFDAKSGKELLFFRAIRGGSRSIPTRDCSPVAGKTAGSRSGI